ncbi:MAG: peptidoglycan-binding protein [Cypionkella sp.]
MSKLALSLLMAGSFSLAAPAHADTDFGQIVSGIAQSLISQEADRAAYVEAQRVNNAQAYRNYLTKFPKGAFRVNAQNALVKLGANTDPVTSPQFDPTPQDSSVRSAASIESSLGLSRSQRIVIQKQLSKIGYSTGVADGLWGSTTRKAIGRWQTANKLQSSGYVTSPQVRLIARQAGPSLEPNTDGSVAGDDMVEERLLSLTSDERREVQRRLTNLGYSTGGVDGAFGRNTRLALTAWQRDEGLRASGYLTADQLRLLRRETGG